MGVIKFCNKHSSGAATHFGNAEISESSLKRPADIRRNSRSKTLNFRLGRETNFCRVLACNRPCIFTHRIGNQPRGSSIFDLSTREYSHVSAARRKIRGIYNIVIVYPRRKASQNGKTIDKRAMGVPNR